MYKIYSIPSCSWCEKAKQFAEDIALEWDEMRLNTPDEVKKFFAKKDIQPPNRTFPRIYQVNEGGEEVLIGGYRQLLEKFMPV